MVWFFFFFSSRRRHTRSLRDWSSDVCSSDLVTLTLLFGAFALVDGISNTVSAVGGRRENENWGVLLLAGLAGIGIGVRSEERRVGKSVDLGGRRMIKQKK